MTNLLRPADYVAADRVPADQRYAYGDEPDQFADLFLPSSPPPNRGYPVVALLHGGCWQQQFGCEPLSALARDLTGAGLSVWNLEYARLGGRGGWPNTFLDVAAGVVFTSASQGQSPVSSLRLQRSAGNQSQSLVMTRWRSV